MKIVFILVLSFFSSLAFAGTCIPVDSSGVYENYCAQRTAQGQNYCEATRVCRWVGQQFTAPERGYCYSRTGNPADDSICSSRARFGQAACVAGGLCFWYPQR